jgi:hypothetical protein
VGRRGALDNGWTRARRRGRSSARRAASPNPKVRLGQLPARAEDLFDGLRPDELPGSCSVLEGLYGIRGQVGEAAGDLGVLADVVAGADPVVAVGNLQRTVEAQFTANEQDR